MMSRLNKILEAISPGALDTLMKYSKSSPDYMLDKLLADLRRHGFNVDINKSDDKFYYLTLGRENGTIKDIKLSREDLVTGQVNMEDII